MATAQRSGGSESRTGRRDQTTGKEAMEEWREGGGERREKEEDDEDEEGETEGMEMGGIR